MEPVTYVATIEAPSPIAEAVAARLEAAESPVAMAVTLFECGPGQIEVSAHYAEKPARERLIQLIDGVAADGGVSLLRIEQLPAKNWVAEAESLRGPVRAGRFLVHGRHDRGKVPAGRFTLEIDAGLAFGTAHHATTRGCLIALDRLLKRGSPGPRARCRHRDRHPRHRRRQGSRRACDCERHGPGRRRRRYRKRFEGRRSIARPGDAGRRVLLTRHCATPRPTCSSPTCCFVLCSSLPRLSPAFFGPAACAFSPASSIPKRGRSKPASAPSASSSIHESFLMDGPLCSSGVAARRRCLPIDCGAPAPYKAGPCFKASKRSARLARCRNG